MTPAETAYRLLEGRGLVVGHFGERLRLEPGERVRRPAASHASQLARAA